MTTRRTLLMTICSFVIAASPIAAQRAPLTGRDTVAPPPADTTTRYYAQKDPALAGILSWLVPGAGSMYAGRVGKGFLLDVLTVGAWYIAINEFQKPDGVKPAIVLPVIIHVSAILTAAEDARRWNARRAGRPIPRLTP